ncbi:MAG: pentapeptide repeat-containing protein, partial [Alphaproteobacteria bacterium]
GARFQGRAVFKSVTFFRPVSFRNAVISGWIICAGCHFYETADFSAALELDEFGREPSKNWALINDGTFEGTTEGPTEEATTESATFHSDAVFINRRFGSGVSFRGVDFRGRVQFQNAQLHPDMTFHGARFRRHRGRAPWPRLTKSDRENTPLRRRIENIAFTFIWPFRLLWFAFQLYWPFFLRRPREWFRFSLIPIQPFRRSRLRMQMDAGTEDLERDYRTLKLAMEENRSRTEESLFFGHELSARLNRCDVPLLERAFLILYWLVSDFGRSLTRSLFWLAAWQPAMVFAYAAFENGGRLPPLARLGDGSIWQFAVQQTTRPFSVWSEFYRRYAAEWAKPYFCHPEFTAAGGTCKSGLLTLQMIGTAHSLGVLVLLFLFLVVLRRRFQMN